MPRSMRFGVCDPGKKQHVYQDPAMRAAIDRLGLDFLMHHIYGSPRVEDVRQVAAWAEADGRGFFVNQETTDRPRGRAQPDGPYQRPGFFFQPDRDWVQACAASPRFMGVCYDEAEHWATNGVWVTTKRSHDENVDERGQVRPHFFDAQGSCLAQAYEGNLHNLRALLAECYGPLNPDAHGASHDQPRRIVCTEQVFPIMGPLFARAGISPFPKYLKESVTPVFAAMALGAARQYGTTYGACLDLWAASDPGWPGHDARRLAGAMQFAYWSGCDLAYVENINFQGGVLYEADGPRVQRLTTWGQAVQRFARDYMPAHPRPRAISTAGYRPRIAMVRFPDTDWGQTPRAGYISGTLYGATNLQPDAQTRYWLKLWHLISHGTIPATGLTWHADGYRHLPFRFVFPCESTALYDHMADDPALFAGTRLVFLAGKVVSETCMRTLAPLVKQGLIVVGPSHLMPSGHLAGGARRVAEERDGAGAWIVADDPLDPVLRERLAPLLGDGRTMRLSFDGAEVVFFADEGGGLSRVELDGDEVWSA